MRFSDLKEAVEKNIAKLFMAFYENPAIFLSEADIKCYLYALLIDDPFFRNLHPNFKYQTPKEKSTTLLIHSELRVEMRGKDKNYDIAILKPSKVITFSDCEIVSGIEIKFNTRDPARNKKSNILEDIKKVSFIRQGYILWLNWDREINDVHLKKVENLIRRYENVKLFYLDMFSEPIRTNVNEISRLI